MDYVAAQVQVDRSEFAKYSFTIFYGKDGDLTDPDHKSAEVSTLALHLLQSALVHGNILLQNVLDTPGWAELLGEHDHRALSPLFWSNIHFYGQFRLNMDTQLDLTTVAG